MKSVNLTPSVWHRLSVVALLAAAIVLPANRLKAQKASAAPANQTSITNSEGHSLTANPNSGQITAHLPKTNTTVTVNAKKGTTSVKDNKSGKSTPPISHNPPPKPPADKSTAGNTKVDINPNPDGSITIVVTNGNQTDTITVKPETNPQTGQTTTSVSSPADPSSKVSLTTDKNNNVTGTGATTPAPSGQSFEVTKGPDGLMHIYSKNQNGQIVSDQLVGKDNDVVIGQDKIPHIVNKQPGKETESAEGAQPETPTPGAPGATPAPTNPSDGKTSSNYRLLVPDIAQEGEEFTGMVVEETAKGDVPVADSNQVVFNGEVLPQQPDHTYKLPPFERQLGNYFIGVAIVPPTVNKEEIRKEPIPTSTQHMEIVPAAPGSPPGSPEIARAASVVGPGTPLRVEGRNLQTVQRAALVDDQSNQVALGDSAGSSLQRIYLPSSEAKMPPGAYRYVCWDAAGNRYEAPNASQRPRLQINGPPIERRGQRGEFTITSDTSALVELSGGDPIISLDERMVNVRANVPAKVKFTAQQVGQYSVRARMFSPEDLPRSANIPRVNSQPEPIAARYDPRSNQTSINTPVRVTDGAGKPVANVPVDVVITKPDGIEYTRVTTDNHGRATIARALPGNVPASSVSTHVYRVLGYNWKEPPSGGIPGTQVRGLPVGLGGFFDCPHECTPPAKRDCQIEKTHIKPAGAVNVNVGKEEEAITKLEMLKLFEVAEMVAGPATGHLPGPPGVPTGAEEVVKRIEKRNKEWSNLSLMVTMDVSYEECERKACWFTDFQDVWSGRKQTAVTVPPPAGLGAAEGPEGAWAGGTFLPKDKLTIQALKDARDSVCK